MARTQRGPKIRPLSIYLLKPSVRSAQGAVETPEDLASFPVPIGRTTGRLFVKPSHVRPPAWASFFDGAVDFRSVSLKSASTSALLVLRVKGRFFAVAFGYGRHLLEPGSWDANFGLRVTLNAIEPDSVRSIDRKSFDAISRHTREEASREGSIDQFGINVDRDLLRAVVGRPKSLSLGRMLAGMDALTATIGITLQDLPSQLELYLQQWRKRSYKKRYPWVDQISEVRDGRQRAELDERLVARLARGDLEKSWLSVPVPIDWSQVGGFRYTPGPRAETYDDIHLASFLDSFRNPEDLKPEHLRRRAIYCLDPDGQHAWDKWTAYQCLYAEMKHQGNVFLLTGGHWYRVAPGFVSRVDGDIAQIAETTALLPRYSHGSEGEYNRSVSRRSRREFALMDGKNIPYGGGASRIEFCDLYTRSRVMIHVKRYGASSVLSHLFAQGLVAATLFLQDSDFRKAVNRRLPESHRLARPERRPTVQNYEVAFAIVSKSAGELQLPFFSKVNLRNAYQTLTGLGYDVTLTKIAVNGRQPSHP